MLFGATLAGLLVGYLAGLWSFKVKSRWCPRCGATTSDLLHKLAGHQR
jgi:ribosomal protein S27AE